jgi:hypothetical protein
MSRFAGILLVVSVFVSLAAQDQSQLELVKKEAELSALFQTLYSDTLTSYSPVIEEILTVMPEALMLEGAMEFAWNRLDRIGVITSDDNKVRIFTWHVMEDPDHYRYYGYIQVGDKRDRIRVFVLEDNQKPQRNLQVLDQSTEHWYGKLYYQIVSERHKRKEYYTLLGMDFNDSRSTIKTIETISLQRNKPKFEKGLFLYGNSSLDRVVLEYSSQVSMSVRYDRGINMITFDHLEPLHPIYKNNFEFYGPDGSFDGLEFMDGIWIFHRDIDARNRD